MKYKEKTFYSDFFLQSFFFGGGVIHRMVLFVVKYGNDVEGPGTISEHAAQDWFRRFKEGDTSFEDKPKLETRSVVEDETLLEMANSQAHCQQNLVLDKAPSIDTAI